MLEQVLTELQRMNLCGSPSEFSREWLLRDQSYYRSLKWQNRAPSDEVIRNCAAKLSELAQCFISSGQDHVIQKGLLLLALRRRCDEAIQQGKSS